MADDDEELFQNLEHEASQPGARIHAGPAEGGPLDGIPIDIPIPFGLQMRGLVFYVAVGDENESAWHTYNYSQRRVDNERGEWVGVAGYFKHLGTIDGDPPNPRDQRPSDPEA